LHSDESALDPAGPQAQRISSLMWLFIWICIGVYVLVMLTLLGAFLHRRRGNTAPHTGDTPITEPDPVREGHLWSVVSGSIVITVITLFILLFADFSTGRALHSLSRSEEPIRVRLTAHQWWWEVEYIDWPDRMGERGPSKIVMDANEIHVPVDPDHPVPVEMDLQSADVIHSFWVPSLHGKKDIIPGHPTTIFLQADQVGTYWGECAEYCGYQHAQMRIVVLAEPVSRFKSWLQFQHQPPPEPTNAMQKRGREVFLQGSCLMCHTISGTIAHGRLGPDLTHIASRRILAAGAIPNAPGHLAGWIMDPQAIKPGVHMPQNNLKAEDLRALLEYLETLK
jgi:cytochrome c oxidase subunit 2